MTDTPLFEHVLGEELPRGYRVSRWLARKNRFLPLQEWIVKRFGERDAFDWEWYLARPELPRSIQASMVAPRFPISLKFLISEVSGLGKITVRVRGDGDWREVRVDSKWEEVRDGAEMEITMLQLVLAKDISIQTEKDTPFSFRMKVSIAPYVYRDLVHVVNAHENLESNENQDAVEHLEEAFRLEPRHFFAADLMSRAGVQDEDWERAKLWAMRSVEHSDGNWGREALLTACEKDQPDLIAEAAACRDDAKEWDVGGHLGVVCLKKEESHWLGFGCHHLSQYRQIIDIRRQAAARMLRHLHFSYIPNHQGVAMARVRVLRSDNTISEVPADRLVYMDDPEHNPAIKTESRKRAQFYLPELNRGDCICFEYAIVNQNPRQTDSRPDLFIMADMNCDFPAWRSEIRITCPTGWDLRCLPINDAPEPVCTMDGEWKTYHASARDLHYEEWSAIDIERRYSSPHICCSWNDRSWADIAEYSLEKNCHSFRDDGLPRPLAEAITPGESDLEKLRLGHDWIRDRLKYMSLPIAKERTSDPDLANKIVAAGVGDCMDKAYLVLLLCQKLGLEAEYILTSAEYGHMVEDLPGPQFDHILVRARPNGNWLYLDATSTDTPFGWIPIYLQGIPVLSLGESRALDHVSEELPERNTVKIDEALECCPDGTLQGGFSIRTFGIPARYWDDQWKSASLSVNDPAHVASMTVLRQLPSVTLQEWELQPAAAGDPRFTLTGRHTRRRMVDIGERRVGSVSWETPMFPHHWAKNREWHGMALFPLPMTFVIRCQVKCPEGWIIEGSSDIPRIETEFGRVTATQRFDDRTLHIERTLVIGNRFIRGDAVGQVTEFLKVWEDALQLAFLIRPNT
jgi:hypothetical protein